MKKRKFYSSNLEDKNGRSEKKMPPSLTPCTLDNVFFTQENQNETKLSENENQMRNSFLLDSNQNKNFVSNGNNDKIDLNQKVSELKRKEEIKNRNDMENNQNKLKLPLPNSKSEDKKSIETTSMNIMINKLQMKMDCSHNGVPPPSSSSSITLLNSENQNDFCCANNNYKGEIKNSLHITIENEQKKEEELWKDVPKSFAFVHNYEASTLGRIRRKDTKKICNNDGNCHFPTINGEKSTQRKKLIASVFISNPQNYKFVTHLDGDILNFKPSNLKWIEHKQKISNLSLKKRKVAKKMKRKLCKDPSLPAGVYFLKKRNAYQATIYINGKRTSKCFSITNSDPLNAKQEAISWRKEREQEKKSGEKGLQKPLPTEKKNSS